MGDMLIQGSAQTPAPARASNAAAAAEAAQLDARLELAAKKAALRSLEAQAQAEAPAAEAPIAAMPAPQGRIVIERDGKTVILDNPTPEQLQSLGLSAGTTQRPLEGWQVLGQTGIIVGGAVLLTAIILWYRRSMRGAPSPAASAQSEARMARIENAVESIAVEVERISEGQRYTSRMLAEGTANSVSGAPNSPEMVRAGITQAGGGQ